ncbi:histidine ammonia-lyase 2 [Caldinitratiruptor microaerophilus]|uniref:Histidine ammonia-lyase n=1 Tax=Caldinitratiruptor microaerophilus TaxID=671077 RepID=A0AA35CP06_9FIRM|nr:histidine ammonia-lyase [Caldinitratiruptor microaerophilus]BDG62053.1 histidine ammonia-lyase 2 [Caldinitratiruptor microaerophilus]
MDVIPVGRPIGLAEVVAVAGGRAQARLAPEARARVEAARALVQRLLARRQPVYGVTTGFGKFSDVPISPEEVARLQHNLLVSHAAGVGEPLDDAAVRAAMLLRAQALAQGHSGVRPAVVDLLLEMLNRGVHPVVPSQGSLGASGDLAPLAHLALVLVGEGEARYRGERLPGREALARAGLRPLTLEAKEGLALINGTQIMTGIGALALAGALDLLKVADVAAALTAEALGAIPTAWDPRIQELRGHPGQAAAAANLRRLTQGSALLTAPGEVRVQDAYTLRCIPQVHGASRTAIDHVAQVVGWELNAVTDNPLLFPDEGEVLSGGNFHGQPVALAMDYLGIAVAELASMSERRVERLLNPTLSGLPAFLTRAGGLNSGLMILQYTAAALVSENKVLAHPASVDSIPSSANQEDHVSMGTIAARKARRIVEHARHVLAIELVCAAQAVEFHDPRGLGAGTRAAYRAVRERIPPLAEDRLQHADIARAVELIESGALLSAVEGAVGPLE